MKNDYISDCVSDLTQKIGKSIPIDAVNKEYCLVCANRECVRAGVATKTFFNRAQNWEKDLFLNVKRMEPDSFMARTIASAWIDKPVEIGSIVIPSFPDVSPVIDPSTNIPISITHGNGELDHAIPAAVPVIDQITDAVTSTMPEIAKPVRNPFSPPTRQPVEPIKQEEVVISSGSTFTFD